jgi:hypothetical protein
MEVQMAKRNGSANRNKAPRARRVFDREFKEQAVQMMLDGLSASTVSGNLGLTIRTCSIDGRRKSSKKVEPLRWLWTRAFAISKRSCGALSESETY